jgi:hypothetical protein
LIVTAALQQYADRGVFRGFSVAKQPGGRYQYGFTWLMRRPFTLTYDPVRGVLSFKDLFPEVGPRSAIAMALRSVVAERSTRRIPEHKRLDARRVQAACAVQRGRFSLTMRVQRSGAAKARGKKRTGRAGGTRETNSNDEYAVRQLLNLVNELFLTLHESYPDYLIEHFGLSSE